MASVAGTSGDKTVDQHGWRVLAILSALMGFASISTDLYLPAMPTMARALATDQGTMEYTVSGYLGGFSLGQLFWGPIADRFGRRIPLAVGLLMFVVGSGGCALSTSATAIIACRVFQALGACAGVVLARAMVRDLYEGHRSAQIMSTLMTIMAIAPLLGPIVGAQILALGSWRAVFWTLVGVGIATLASLRYLPETLPPARRNREPLWRAIESYRALIGNRQLLGLAGTCGFFFMASFAYVAASPFAYIEYYHVPPQLYGLLFGSGIVGMMAANIVSGRLVMRWGSERLLRWGTACAAAAGLILAIDAWSGLGGLAGLAVPLFLLNSMTGLVVANAIAAALGRFPERAGAVSALVGAIQYGMGIAGSALVGTFADGTPWPLGWVIAIGAVGSAACAWLVLPSKLEGLRCDGPLCADCVEEVGDATFRDGSVSKARVRSSRLRQALERAR